MPASAAAEGFRLALQMQNLRRDRARRPGLGECALANGAGNDKG